MTTVRKVHEMFVKKMENGALTVSSPEQPKHYFVRQCRARKVIVKDCMFKAAESGLRALGEQRGVNKTLVVPLDLQNIKFSNESRSRKKTSSKADKAPKANNAPKAAKPTDAPKITKRGRYKDANICREQYVAPLVRCTSSEDDVAQKRCDEVSKRLLWEPGGDTRRFPSPFEIEDNCPDLLLCSKSQKRILFLNTHPDRNGSSPAATNAFQALMTCLKQVGKKIQRTR